MTLSSAGRTWLRLADDSRLEEPGARKDLRDSEVFETALRRYLGLDLLQTVWERNRDLDPDEADRLAYDELDAARAERRSR